MLKIDIRDISLYPSLIAGTFFNTLLAIALLLFPSRSYSSFITYKLQSFYFFMFHTTYGKDIFASVLFILTSLLLGELIVFYSELVLQNLFKTYNTNDILKEIEQFKGSNSKDDLYDKITFEKISENTSLTLTFGDLMKLSKENNFLISKSEEIYRKSLLFMSISLSFFFFLSIEILNFSKGKLFISTLISYLIIYLLILTKSSKYILRAFIFLNIILAGLLALLSSISRNLTIDITFLTKILMNIKHNKATTILLTNIETLIKNLTIENILLAISLITVGVIFWLFAELAIKYRAEANLFLFLASQEARREQRAEGN